jgi:hypothetical protein
MFKKRKEEKAKQKEYELFLQKCAAIQNDYWLPNEKEKSKLLEKFPDKLNLQEQIRLHHLMCSELFNTKEVFEYANSERKSDFILSESELTETISKSAKMLIDGYNQCPPRVGAIWHDKPDENSDPDAMGLIHNGSITHLGMLEVIEIDPDTNLPVKMKFISFKEISGIAIQGNSYFNFCNIFDQNDNSMGIQILPILYGYSAFY